MSRHEIKAITDLLYCVSMPMPGPLKSVNCYLLHGREGWTIVDAGYFNDTTMSAWLSVFETLDITPADVRQILVTHYHPDHYGAAGWLHTVTNAPVLVHEKEIETILNTWHPQFDDHVYQFCLSHGVPPDQLSMLIAQVQKTRRQVAPHPEFTPIKAGQQLHLGDRDFSVLWTPGHTSGLIVLWNETENIMLANDMVLDDITPNISMYFSLNQLYAGSDPLQDFLSSLDRVELLPAEWVLTGHRRPVSNLRERCRAIKVHHDIRLNEIAQYVQTADSAWQVGIKIFGNAMFGPDTIRAALGETVAHLEHLVHKDIVRRFEDDQGQILYQLR